MAIAGYFVDGRIGPGLSRGLETALEAVVKHVGGGKSTGSDSPTNLGAKSIEENPDRYSLAEDYDAVLAWHCRHVK